VIVVSSAIRPENPELAEARKRGIEIWPRAKMLAALAGDRTTIAVAGTHGKTSTSAMVATMLAAMELDPTFVVGGEVSAFATNARNGSGAHYVVEADESDGSFMYMDPGVAIVTNVEADHLDHYGSLDAVERTFVEFMCRVPQDGHLVLCGDDERLLELARDCPARTVTYGFATDVDVRCRITGGVGLGHRFEVVLPDGTVHESSIRVPGRHMVQNATAAIATAWALGLDIAAASAALAEFDGVKRRFDMIGEACGISVVDDYAHHPTEVKATLAAARECDYSRVWVVFQPHRYSRTEALAREFGAAFADADRVVLMDVYSAGEAPIPGVSGKTVLDELLEQAPRARAAYLPHRTDVAPYLAGRLRPGDLVLTMGAGDVTTMGIELLRAVAPEVDGAA
jgi:UDP-N-acetylmuramate--alanine ligase